MNHYQYYIINSHFKKTLIENKKNKIIIDDYKCLDFINLLHLANDTIIDIYVFGYTINKVLFDELNLSETIESLCTQIDKARLAKGLNENSIKLNILYISQFRTCTDYPSDKLTPARVDDFFEYSHPHYASIVKLFFQDGCSDIITKIFPKTYEIAEPLSRDVCATLIKDEDIMGKVCGVYITPNFDSFDELPKY